jgi:hypothetical protein
MAMYKRSSINAKKTWYEAAYPNLITDEFVAIMQRELSIRGT